jgi:streptomycin 6-kinase
MSIKPLSQRLAESISGWRVIVQSTLETPSSLVVYGTRNDQPVVLKVSRQPGDEWHSGNVLTALAGSGIVQVYEYTDGAVLLERLYPGTPLADLALQGRDDEATAIIASVIERLSQTHTSLSGFNTVGDWGKAFDRYRASGDRQIAGGLIERGQYLYTELCASQRRVRLLHGDLQHYNILFDQKRGWVAIDPKGVVGEIEYEIGASLRNPYEKPELFASRERVEKRLKVYESVLKLNYKRALEWGFAQAVLSAIWTVEDGYAIDDRNFALALANAIQPMLE